MHKLIHAHKSHWSDKTYARSTAFSFLLLGSSLYVSSLAIEFAKKDAGNATTDLLLDNIPVINTDIIFSEGAMVFILFVTIVLLFRPVIVPYALKSLSLLVVVRSLFVILTHLAPYPDRIITGLESYRYVTAGFDLFFSGHTAIPFLCALIFWYHKTLRVLFIAVSIIAATAVILGHLHYSIDVFSAYFIAYGVHHMAILFFPTDYKRTLTLGVTPK